MSFIGVTYRSVGEGLPAGTEMTQRQLCHRSHPALVAAQKSWKPGVYHTIYRRLNRSRMSVSGSSVYLSLFQTVWLISDCLIRVLTAYICLRWGKPHAFSQSQVLPEALELTQLSYTFKEHHPKDGTAHIDHQSITCPTGLLTGQFDVVIAGP